MGNVEIDGIHIEQKNNIKFLGVVIDEFLTWDEHVSKVLTSMSRCIGIMLKVKYYVSLQTLLTIYNSILLPHVTYCNIVWGSFKS